MSLAACSDRIVLNDELVGKWTVAHWGGVHREGAKCIGLQDSRGKLIAGTVFDNYNGASICMHVAIERITREFLRVCFDYPFNQLGVNVILGFVPEGNVKAIRFDEHVGFRLHSRIPDGHPTGDLLLYIMTRNDCRWLNG
jgi:RimJ/RimL family protein N-acetyltransferase